MADIHARPLTLEQQMLPPHPSAQMHHPHALNQLQRPVSAATEQDGLYAGSMDAGAGLSQDWAQPSADYNGLTSLGFDGMFQFSGQSDSFQIDHTEFASTDFGFPPGMSTPMSSIFDVTTSGSMGIANGLDNNGGNTGLLENNGFHGNSSNGGSSNAQSLALDHIKGASSQIGQTFGAQSLVNSNGHGNGHPSGTSTDSNSDSTMAVSTPEPSEVNLSMAMKPQFMNNRLKNSSPSMTTGSMHHQLQSLPQQTFQQPQQSFNTASMDLQAEIGSFTTPTTQQEQAPTMMFQTQQDEHSFPQHQQHQQQQNHQQQGHQQQQQQQQSQASFPFQSNDNASHFHNTFSKIQGGQHQAVMVPLEAEDNLGHQSHAFGHTRPLSMNGAQTQQQFEEMIFQQQQQHLSSDMKGHFRHASSPNLSEIAKQESALQLRNRGHKPQVQLQHQQESLQQQQQFVQQSPQQRQSLSKQLPSHHSGVHPFSAAPSANGKPSMAPNARTIAKRPSDLHVDISGRTSGFRLNGDVRAGDFRFGNDGRDSMESGSAPLSPSTGAMTAPLTPAFFSPAFGDALGSPGSVLYQNSPFIISSHDRNRTSMQTDSSIGSYMDIHTSSASSPSSLGSLNEVGQRMFGVSADSMQAPVDTVTPMDINFNDMAADLGYLDTSDLDALPTSTGLSSSRDSFCHSPDHVDPHNVEVNPSYFSTSYEDDQQVKMEVMAGPGIDLDLVLEATQTTFSAESLPGGQQTPSESVTGSTPPRTKATRKRRSNGGPSGSPSASSTSSGTSPPRQVRSRTISTTSSLMDEKDEYLDSPRANVFGATMRPIMLTQDAMPPSAKAMRTNIKRFLTAKTPTMGGEKSVLILTSKVAQKSYGTEKRFLCPPPTTMLLGSNWWSSPGPGTPSEDDDGGVAAPTPPKMVISICGEAGSQQGVLDWTTTKDDSVALPIITGKCVSKQLYINDADEKRKKVEVLVKFMMAGDLELGTFASKPIKVISKPSKKRQSIKNMELCIHHGTTISLFNRIRSQTVSTKYLGVSTTTQPSAHAPWNYGNNNLRDWPNLEPSPESAANPVNTDGGTCFVARTGSWDPFVVWIVSPGQTRTETLEEHSQRHPGFPPPPAIAINSPAENVPQTPIHYNQPIVLQCLSTGLVSPVMVIRKVDKGSMVLGGGSAGHASAEYDQEPVGDPVSQLHKVAFQITGQATPAVSVTHPKLQQGTYLACLGDVVGMQRANEGKKYLPDQNSKAASQATSAPAPDNDARSGGNSHFAMDVVPEMPEGGGNFSEVMASWGSGSFQAGGMAMSTPDDQHSLGPPERKRRMSSSVVIKTKAPAKGRRRVNSLSVTQAESHRIRANALQQHQQQLASANFGHGGPVRSNDAPSETKEKSIKDLAKGLSHQQPQRRNSSVWTEDVTDAAVWTIVGTDCAQYNFCTPGDCENLSLPRSPVTPSPKVMEVCLNGESVGTRLGYGPISVKTSHSNQSETKGQEYQHLRNGLYNSHGNSTRTLTLKGHGFDRQLSVWFGTIQAPLTEMESPEVLIACVPEEVSLGSSFYFTKDDDEEVETAEDEDDQENGHHESDHHRNNNGQNNAHHHQHQRKNSSSKSHPDRFKRKRVKGVFASDCIPILLVRKDGVIFRSGHSITLG